MRLFTALFALCATLVTGAAWAEECKLSLITSLDLTVTPRYLLVPATFGGVSKDMIFRMETAQNSITPAAVAELGLTTERISSVMPGLQMTRYGQKVTTGVKIPELKLGTLAGKNLPFIVTEAPADSTAVAGELGTSLFHNLDWELDIAHKKLNFFTNTQCPGPVAYWTQDSVGQMPLEMDAIGGVRVKMELDGKPLSVMVQTNGPSVMPINVVRDLFGLEETAPEMVSFATQSDGSKVYRYPFKALSAGGVSILNPNIAVVGDIPGKPPRKRCRASDRCYGQADLVLGVGVLSKLRLYFATKEKKLYATAADAH